MCDCLYSMYICRPLIVLACVCVSPNSSQTIQTNQSLSPLEQTFTEFTTSDMFRLAIRSAKTKMSMLKNPWTLYISDVGGQLEFQELVPALTSGPSFHIVVLAAHWGLNNKCPIEYLHKSGRSALPYKASYTVKENILQAIATIMSTGQHDHKHLPKTLFVVTFKDLVSEQQLLDMDKELQEAIKSTEAYHLGVIEFADDTHLCHTINNLSPDKADVLKIRKTIERIGKKYDQYQICTPYSWLCFGLALRGMKAAVLHYTTCVEAGRQCGIETVEEVNAALKFLHYNIGVIRHFSDVPELCDIVITEPQILFDNVTELVVNTFTFDCVSYSIHEDFNKKGIFPMEMVNKLSTGSELLTVEKFISFLIYHHIIAPIEDEDNRKKYFLPCSLVHAEDIQDSHMEQTGVDDICPPLLISFDTGYIPRGIFGFLVSDLLTGDGEFTIDLDEDHIYRDQLTISVGPYVDKFRLSIRATYIQISVEPSIIDRKFPLGKICCYMQKRVCEGLLEIVKKLNYNCNATHSLAFLCPGSCIGKQLHPANVTFYRDEVQALKCCTTKKVKCLPNRHDIWFNEVIKHNNIIIQDLLTYVVLVCACVFGVRT